MKVLALMPVRNEAWVLRQSLSCLSAFCDVVLVDDQSSTDASVEICRTFPKVVLLEAERGGAPRLPQHARWRLLDAARDYDGLNLLWCTDADELPVPESVRRFLQRREACAPGTVIRSRVYNVWGGMDRFRDDWSAYGPQFRPLALFDDRTVDYPRAADRPPLHEPRVPGEADRPAVDAGELVVLHLQWAIWNRNQMKQAWYRCIEWLDGRTTPAAINDRYAITLPNRQVRTTRLPLEWLREITLPPALADTEPSWHEREIVRWFDEHGVERFEPLEIWHVRALRQEFRRRTGRAPRPDRSYLPTWPVRGRAIGRRMYHAVRGWMTA